MKVDTFFQNFELLTDAPNAVVKLRELILQLAVRGKLVTQKDDNEPASFLLEKIEIEKKKLIKSKKIKRIETLPINKDISFLFKLSKKWALIRLGDLVEKLGAGSTPLGGKNVYVDDGIKFLRSQNVWNDGLNLDEVAYITSEIHQKMSGTVVEAGDILLNITGASIGRCAVVPDDFDEGNVSQHVSIIRLINKDLRYYLHLCLISSLIQNQIMEVQVGISREGLSMNRLKDFLIPVPPLAEQKRIVEKCDRLLSICDEIEKRQQQRQESILRMNESAIAQLLSSQNAEEFRQHWQRICNNFDLLYSIPETIPKLRQAILQLAVQGKLVRQNPNDESASFLLKNIQYEKEKLIESKQIKQEKALPKMEQDIVPFVIPDGWEWCYLSDISKKITDGEHLTPQRSTSGYYLLSARNVRDEGIALDDVDYVPEDEFVRIRKRCDPDKGDILISCSGSVGRVATVDKDETYVMVRSAALVKPFQAYVISEFLAYTLRSLLVQNQIIEKSKASAQANLFLGKIKEIKIVLPPLAEQKRIVEKCDRLMSLCDTLEAKLKQGRDSSEKLMEVAAKQVLTA
ncbi:MAG: restriction endonuclease subunit S [Aulosira sp. DedQUE10]|nr:restriction endonuclease subunit S [Aulosira sp. DedQUE10]